MRIKPREWFGLILVVMCLSPSDGLAVMSVDLGSEYMKIAIVKPGVPMEIALNFESRRKTSVVVSMKNGERLFSDPAMNVAVKYPKYAYQYLQDLMAKSLDNPVIKRYQERFPYFDLQEDPETKTVVFKHDEETSYTPEELLAMVLEHAKDIAEKFAEQPVNDAVITVPPYFNQAERRAMMRAGEMAGLKILQLMNDNTAVALNYGIFRRKAFNSTPVHYMFFDMGATSTSVSIVTYQEIKEKNKITGTLDKYPQVHVRGVGFDRNLGGLEFQLRLRDHLAKLFNEQKKTKTDVRENKRSMGKLFKEAGRLKNVLSANVYHMTQVESLLEDHDFKAKVTREEFETICQDLYDKVDKVVKAALKSSEFTMDEISEVILMGGSTRMPKIQEKLQEATGRKELGKSINTDEASALGAVYQAAHLSKGFKVKKFGIKEATIYPIQVEFDRVKQTENMEKEKRTVTRMLFARNNPYPQKKVMTFNKHTKDFEFEVNYGEIDFLNEEELKSFGSRSLQKISLSGIEDAYGKHDKEAESKGVKAHFKMEESGIIELDRVELVFERQPIPAEEKPAEEKSTLEKIGSAFGSLFGGGADAPADPKNEDSSVEKNETETTKKEGDKPSDSQQDEKSTKEADSEQLEKDAKPKEDKKPVEEDDSASTEKEEQPPEKTEEETKEEKPKEEETTDDKKDEEKKEDRDDTKESKSSDPKKDDDKDEKEKKDKEGDKKDKKEDKKDKGDKKEKDEDKKGKDEKKSDKKDKKEEKKEEKPKPVTIREDIKSSTVHIDTSDPSKDAMKASRKKIKDLKKKDEEKALLEKAKNDLETFIIDAQDKIYQDDYQKCSTEEDREKYSAKLSEASDWLYEQEEGTGKEPYIEKLKELVNMVKNLFDRVKERQDRPRAMEALNHMVNYSEHFLVNMKNFTGEEPGEQPFTKVEYETLEKLIIGTKEWNKTMQGEQAKTPDTEKPKLLVEDIARKISEIDREVKYLVNKAKTFRPKPKKEEKKNATKTDANATKTDANATKTEEENVKDSNNTTKDFKTEEIKIEDPPKEGGTEKPKKNKNKKTSDTKTEEDGETLQIDGSEDSSAKSTQEEVKTESKDKKDSKTETKSDSDKAKDSSKKDKNHDPEEL